MNIEKPTTGLLTPELKKPLDRANMGHEVAALNNLLGMLNNPELTGAEVPPGEVTKVQSTQPNPLLTPSATAPAALASNASAPSGISSPSSAPGVPTPSRNLNRVFYTGRLCAGKDHVALAAKSTVLNPADPIYALVNYFIGDEERPRQFPGMQSLLQTIGQWGRGEVSAQYPMTPTRLLFVHTIRNLGGFLPDGVNWEHFGQDKNIWLEALAARIAAIDPSIRVAITNVRFENEFKFFKGLGFEHYHVACSSGTWTARLAKRGISPESPAAKDPSEALAAHIDKDAITTISRAKNGTKLHVIWNDTVPPPSSRFITLAEYLGSAAAAPAPAEEVFNINLE